MDAAGLLESPEHEISEICLIKKAKKLKKMMLHKNAAALKCGRGLEKV